MNYLVRQCLVAGAAVLGLGHADAALKIYADLDGDGLHDASASMLPGASFSMAVYALEDGAHGGLTSYGLQVLLPAGLSIAGATDAAKLASIVSDPIWDLPETKTVSPAIDVIDGTFFGAYTGALHLFSVGLVAPLTPGPYAVSFKNVEPDATFDGFVGFDGFVYDASNVFDPSVITVVPEPASAALMSLGVAALALGWRRRAAKRQG